MSWYLNVHGKGDALIQKLSEEFDRTKKSYEGTAEGDSIERVKQTVAALVVADPDKTHAFSITARGSVCNGVPELSVELKPLHDFAG